MIDSSHNMNSPSRTTKATTSELNPSLSSLNNDQTTIPTKANHTENAALSYSATNGRGPMRGDNSIAAGRDLPELSNGMIANGRSHSSNGHGQQRASGSSSSSRAVASALAAISSSSGTPAMEKENLQPPSNSRMEHESQRHCEPTKAQLPSRNGLVRNGLTRNGLVRNGSSQSEDSLEGVRLCYFDENNVMDGALNGIHSQYTATQYGEADGNGYSEQDYLPNQHPVQYANNNQYANQSNDNNEEEEEDDYEDDISEESGGTVVHNDIPSPPQNATQEEMRRYYWEWCYGPVKEEDVVQLQKQGTDSSVMKVAPAKSCLSTKKKSSSNKPPLDSMTPRRILQHSPSSANPNNLENRIMRPSTPTEEVEDTTPINNITRLAPIPARTHSAVKFGNNSAAEFDFLQPITEMTPIPSPVVQKIFPTDVKETEKDIEEAGLSRETAQNVAALAEWDDDFDSIISEDDDRRYGGGPSQTRRGRKRGGTPYKHSGQRRRSSASVMSRPRKNRRESLLFSRERRSLIEMEDNEGMNDDDDSNNNANGRRRNGGNLLPFSVTIDPEEYTSPSSTSVADSISTLGTPAALSAENDDGIHGHGITTKEDKDDMLFGTTENQFGQMRRGRDSLDSACISPSSLKSSECNNSTASIGLDDASMDRNDAPIGVNNNGRGRQSNDSNTTTSTITTSSGKETPNSARTSSSTIIRAIHTSGALLSGSSPPQSGLGGVAASSCPVNGDGRNGGLLRPNQLKYSPSSSSSSSGAGSSGSSTMRMDISPSSSESIGSDIMGLFTQQSLNDNIDNDSENISLSKQLSAFSSHPMQPFHTILSDLLKLIESSSTQKENKDLVAFMNEHMLRGLSPSASLSLIVDERNTSDAESIFCGNSEWLQSAFFDEKSNAKSYSAALKSFESILLKEVEEASSNPPSSRFSKQRPTTMADADMHTIGSCIQLFHQVSCMDWSSMELDSAMRILGNFEEWAKLKKEEMHGENNFVSTCCKKLVETSAMAMRQLAKSNDAGAAIVPAMSDKKKLALRKRKVQSEMKSISSEIKSLEHQLALEVSRHDDTKRVKRLFDAHLEMERCSPIAALTGEIRTSIIPAPIMTLIASDFSFKFFDGSAEVVMKFALNDDDDASMASTDMQAVDLGCFIKEGGPSIQFLQAILLGNIDMKLESVGPFALRECIRSMVLENENREELTQQMTLLFSRIDMLIRSVKDLEMNGFCTVNTCGDGDLTLLVSMSHKGAVVQVGFLFRNLLRNDWCVRTFPDDVNVSIVSTAERNPQVHQSELQVKARSILAGLKGSSADPILLRRMCKEVMESFTAQESGS